MKEKVIVITDSVAYFPSDLVSRYNIKIVPLSIIIDGNTYTEQSIDLGWFYQQISHWRASNKLPTSSSITPEIFLESYREASRQAEGILHICHSSQLGMTYKAALQAKERAKQELPGTAVEVVDSHTACGAQMLIVLGAARAVESGENLDKVTRVARKMVTKANFIVMHNDLYYLAKGGRIHRARPWASTKITNTALLECDDSTNGEHAPVARCRTKGETLRTLFGIVEERSNNNILRVAINHASAAVEAEELRKKTMSRFSCAEVFVSEVGPVVALHTGIGTIWFSWWSEG